KKDSIDGNAERFGQQFNQIVYSRDSIMGSGAYRLDSWVLGQSLSLKKKNDWWGNGILEASPDKITYLFVPDEATAITMLKSGDVDLVSSISPTVFADLKKDSAASQLEFHTPKVMQYYYLALNNQNSLLKDKRVRKALAHLLDLEKMSKVLMADLAKPIASPIHSSKTYHNSNLQPIGYDPEKARQLLFESGWSDTDGDGVLENTLNNETEELSLDILVTQKALGRNIARILKENAQEVGIEINIKGQNWGEIVRQINSQDYHIAAMATRQHPGLDDLYQSWHTASIGPDGRNITGFGTARTDSIINILRTTEDAQQRKELFLMIQEIIYEEQPMIFLFSPTETIIHRSDIEIQISSKRPGYFENTAQTK
ncbi:MAG: ABC transporter substrate-binding protein, partial [Saprospiraceae bacterium]|nr:ABC transporter substrate-binding protein [Saprospiraceae bacterium]